MLAQSCWYKQAEHSPGSSSARCLCSNQHFPLLLPTSHSSTILKCHIAWVPSAAHSVEGEVGHLMHRYANNGEMIGWYWKWQPGLWEQKRDLVSSEKQRGSEQKVAKQMYTVVIWRKPSNQSMATEEPEMLCAWLTRDVRESSTGQLSIKKYRPRNSCVWAASQIWED